MSTTHRSAAHRICNPLPAHGWESLNAQASALYTRRVYNIVTATQGKRVLYLNKNDKLTRSQVKAKRFPNANAAIERARKVLRQSPILRDYTFDIAFAYG